MDSIRPSNIDLGVIPQTSVICIVGCAQYIILCCLFVDLFALSS